ncbi:T9SS type A sorting domain-containing protein [Brumimicrobium mesophilum]|uniref:T9SS type A sorting domain-containing protein n=1 Tax=Brumimicrobium mesophilum TaxID=392717 RepID=UPI000D142339|nr:T9SS type A sorting domain-containing protein [Brumimicrobium mesophilum]
MKKSILFTALLFAGSQFLNAQSTIETVSIGAGYADETWYSLENGDQGTKTAADWDLAFDLGGFGTSIRINSGNGVLLYAYPNGDVNDWAMVDTTGLSTWEAVYNSESTWFEGALDQNINPNDPFDVGWGIYDMNTHIISGDSIFIIKLIDDTYRKLRIDQMAGGAFDFTFANLDGTNEVQAQVVKADYTDKLFGYYSIQNEVAVDHEPVTVENWDLFFGKYTGFIPTPYNLTGIIAGPNTEVVQIDGVSDVANYNDWGAETFTTDISTIGADWKEFVFSSMSYEIADDVVYFVKTQAGDVWKLIPTGFGGSSNGDFEFTKEKISALSTDENGLPNAEVVVYPNPAKENVSLILNNMNSNSSTVQILNLNGQVLFNENYVGSSNFEVKNIPVSSFESGVYLVKVNSGEEYFNQKLIIK